MMYVSCYANDIRQEAPRAMKKNIYWIWLLLIPLLTGCPENLRTVDMPRINGTVLVPDGWELLEMDEFDRIRKSGLETISENGKVVPEHIQERSEKAIVLLSLAKRLKGHVVSAVIFVLQTDKEFVEMGAEAYLQDTFADTSALVDKVTAKQGVTVVKKNGIAFRQLAMELELEGHCSSMVSRAKAMPQGLLTIMATHPCTQDRDVVDRILSSLKIH